MRLEINTQNLISIWYLKLFILIYSHFIAPNISKKNITHDSANKGIDQCAAFMFHVKNYSIISITTHEN